MAASSSSNNVRLKYDVFLSFSGEDTRKGFTNTLYDFLKNKGIETFIDDRLTRGKQIEASLMKTIEESMIAVVIFSEKYASSSWCLNELVKIRECNLIIMPIFYKVKPQNVQEQSGRFGVEFSKLKLRNNKDRIRKWSSDLAFAANQSGWDMDNYRTENEVTKEVAHCILQRLDSVVSISSNESSRYIGIASLVDDLRRTSLIVESVGVQFLGLWGMGGIGKTTIAEVLYHQISPQFDSSYFCSIALDVTNYEVVVLRNRIISHILGETFDEGTPHQPRVSILSRLQKKKVLIILDNVSRSDHVTTLVGTKVDPWFAFGSKVVITSRDSDVLKNEDTRVFEIKEMNNHYSFRLFYLQAFKQNRPPVDEEYVKLSIKMVDYAKGVPLALKVCGCHLYKRSKEEWRSALETLETSMEPEVEKVLMISYNSLTEKEKEVFLDIACFFKEYDKNRVQDILDGCGFSATIGITRLIEKCLVTLSVDNKLGMHDLLQKMGQDIVDNQTRSNLGLCRRSWKIYDGRNLLISYQEAKAMKEKPETIDEAKSMEGKARVIEGMIIYYIRNDKLKIHPLAFSKMHNLRLLMFYGIYSSLPEGVQFLPDNLRFLHWNYYPSEYLPSNFSAKNAVELCLRRSNLKKLWNGVQDPVNLQSLKVLNLQHSKYLIEQPDLSSAAKLKELILDHCESLLEIPASIQYLQSLYILSLRSCKRLCNLPSLVNVKGLKNLDLYHCSNLNNFPETTEDIEELNLVGTGIIRWSDSMSYLNKIKTLNLPGILQKLPSTLHLSSLETLTLRGCKIETLPEIVGAIQNLDLHWTNIREVPSSIVRLSFLVKLDLSYSRKLERLPNNFDQLSCLEKLRLSGCKELFKGPQTLSGLNSLKKLYLRACELKEFPAWVCALSSLELLDLSMNEFVSVPDSIRQLSLLESLYLEFCMTLRSLPAELPCWIHDLVVSGCFSLEADSSSVIRNGELRKPPVDDFGRFQYRFNFVGCDGLGAGSRRDIVENAMMRIQNLVNSINEDLRFPLTVTLPEHEFPTPFKSCEGSSITLDLPTNWSNNLFKGFVFGVVVNGGLIDEFKCELRNNEDTYLVSYSGHFAPGQVVFSSSLCLHYSPDREIRQCCGENHRDATHATFYFESKFELGKAHKCGVYLVYAEIEDENNPSTIESVSVETERRVSYNKTGFAMVAENFVKLLRHLAQCFGIQA